MKYSHYSSYSTEIKHKHSSPAKKGSELAQFKMSFPKSHNQMALNVDWTQRNHWRPRKTRANSNTQTRALIEMRVLCWCAAVPNKGVRYRIYWLECVSNACVLVLTKQPFASNIQFSIQIFATNNCLHWVLCTCQKHTIAILLISYFIH